MTNKAIDTNPNKQWHKGAVLESGQTSPCLKATLKAQQKNVSFCLCRDVTNVTNKRLRNKVDHRSFFIKSNSSLFCWHSPRHSYFLLNTQITSFFIDKNDALKRESSPELPSKSYLSKFSLSKLVEPYRYRHYRKQIWQHDHLHATWNFEWICREILGIPKSTFD